MRCRFVFVALFLIGSVRLAAGQSHDHPIPPPGAAESNLVGVPPSPLRLTIDPGLYVDQRWTGFSNADNGYPPDPHGAAGERGILQISNRRVIYTRKDGEPFWVVTRLEEFFSLFQVPGAIIDPRAAYDPVLRRFYVVGIQTRHPADPSQEEAHCYIHLAVSKNAHPVTSGSADWWIYKFDVTVVDGTNRLAMDYTGFGFDGQAIYVTGNLFTMPVGNLSDFLSCRIVAIDKALACAGTLSWKSAFTPNVGYWDLGRAFTLQPATVVGSATPGNVAYFCEVPYYGPTTSVRLWALSQPLGACVLRDTAIVVPDWGGSFSYAPQCGPGNVRTWSPTAQGNAFWRDGSAWFCHTSANAGRAVVHWYRVATNGFPAGAAALGDAGTLDTSPTVHAYQPAIGGNSLGDVAIVFTESGMQTCPTMSYAALRAGAASFSTPQPLTVSPTYAGTPAGSPFAPWGDYASVSEDPIDHGFWITHERTIDTTPGHWSTEWGQIRLEQNESGWPADGRAVRAGQIETRDLVTLPDGSGGMLAVWREQGTVYAQRLLADGSRPGSWPERGARVTIDPVEASSAASDSAGGAFVTWLRFGHAYVTRITSTGALAPGWSSAGIDLGAASLVPRIVADGTGGALLVCDAPGVIAQRVLADGSLPWGANGIDLDAGGWAPDVIADGSGGAIVVWAPGRAQRISSGGALPWGPSGVEISSEFDVPRAAPDGMGGVIAVFQSVGSDDQPDLTAARLDASGVRPAGWPSSGGVSICAAPRAQTEHVIVSDGAGGAIVAWRDARSFTTSRTDVYAQRVRWNGSIANDWPVNGVALCTAAGHQLAPGLAADGAGGAIVVWQDRRSSPLCATGACGDDVYAMHVNGAGQPDPAFPMDGQSAGVAPGNQASPSIARTGAGAAVVAWLDGRVYPDCTPWCTVSVYAQRVLFNAPPLTGVPTDGDPARLALAGPEPNPTAAGSRVAFQIRIGIAWTGRDLRLDVFDLGGRRIRTLFDGIAGPGDRTVTWDLTSDRGERIRPGFYLARLRAGGQELTRSVIVR